ncbi:MAG: SPFH domain-containing protein [Chloroflexota bacterium]
MSNLIKRFAGGASVFVTIIVVVVIVAILLAFSSQFFYLFERVDEQEVGIQFESGQIQDVVGPGVYTDIGLFVELETITTQAIDFTVTDEEIITKDKQRIGLVVSGDIFRPTNPELIKSLWSQYRGVYLDDGFARDRVQNLTRQAMKVCVGDRTFDDNIIGTARDALRACIDEELNKLAEDFGLRIANVVVPEVILSPEVQAALDAIVQSRLETEKAAQDKLRADAQADAEQARQEGEIRVEQSRLQEQAKQEIILAQLEQERVTAQKSVIEAERANELARVEAERAIIEANRANELANVEANRAIIEAEKANQLLAAEQDFAINQALAEAAAEKAKADLASSSLIQKCTNWPSSHL